MGIISKDIAKAKSLLESEELVAIPTETVYGLAGNIFSEKAIKSIFATKKRPFFNPLIVHIPNPSHLKTVVAEVPEKAQKLANKFWPGPLTLVLPKNKNIPSLITAGKNTVAVRVPNHPMTLELLNYLDFPLAAPSANPFGSISPTNAEHVERYFSKQIKMVLDGGDCERGIESTIVGFDEENPIVYRLGSTSLEDIQQCIGPVEIMTKKETSPEAPGMLERHYAPSTATMVCERISKAIMAHPNKKLGVISLQEPKQEINVDELIILSKTGNLHEAAKNLYKALHELDALDLDLIIIEQMPKHGLGLTLNDRIKRATK